MAYQHDLTSNSVTLVVPGLLCSVLSKDGKVIYPPLDSSMAGTPHTTPTPFSPGKAAPFLLLPWSGLALAAVLTGSDVKAKLNALARTSDGTRELDGKEVKATGVIGCLHAGPFSLQTVYDPFVYNFRDAHFFQSSGEVHPTFKPSFTFFPYDFRLSMAETAERLALAIREVQSNAGVTRINIVAHSMGAVTTLSTLARHPELEPIIGNVALIGPPFNGATETLTSLFAAREGLSDKAIAFLADLARIVPTWPGGFYQLLPSMFYGSIAPDSVVRLNREDGPRLTLPAALSFVLGQIVDDRLLLATQEYTASTQKQFIDGPFGKKPTLSRLHLLKGAAPTNCGFYLKEINPINGNLYPYFWKLFSRVGRSQGLGLGADGAGNLICNSAPLEWSFLSSTTYHSDSFILHSLSGMVVLRDGGRLQIVSNASRETPEIWRINERGELECSDGVITVIGSADRGYDIRVRPRSATASDNTRFFINLLDQPQAVIRLDGRAGDGTVPELSQQVAGLTESLQTHRFEGVNHSELIQAQAPLALVSSLLDAAPRSVEFLTLGPAGGMGRYEGGNSKDYSVAGPRGVRIKKMVWRNSPKWVNGLKQVVFERHNGHDPEDLGIGASDGEEKTLDLQQGEYIIKCQGVTACRLVGAMSWQIVRQLSFSTNLGRSLVLGNSDDSDGKHFDLSPPPGYHICGFTGRAGWVLDSIGVYCAPISGWKSPSPPVELIVGPTGWYQDDSFDLGFQGPLLSLTIWYDDRDIKGVGFSARNSAGQVVNLRSPDHGGTPHNLLLDNAKGEYVTSIEGLFTYVGGLARAGMVNQLTVKTSLGQILKVGKGKDLALNGSDPLPFTYMAPRGYQIAGLIGQVGGWGLMALGCHLVPHT